MTVNLEIFATALINRFLWEVLKANDIMVAGDYPVDPNDINLGTYVPIIPLSEEPELSRFNKPYIVYGYAETYTDAIPYKHSGSVSYVVHSQDVREVNKIVTLIGEVFGEEDISAARLNKYTSNIADFVGLRFTMTKVGYVEGGEPVEEEGGRVSSLINIRYDYVPDYNVVLEPKTVTSDGTVTEWD